MVHHWFEGDRAALLAMHPNTVFYEDPGLPDAACVAVNRAEAVRLAVRHLVQRGRRRIGLAVMTLARPTHVARYRGYCLELQAHGLPLDDRLIFNGQAHGLAFAQHNSKTTKWDFPIETIDRVIEQLRARQRRGMPSWPTTTCGRRPCCERVAGPRHPRTGRRGGGGLPEPLPGRLDRSAADHDRPRRHAAAARQMVLMLEKMIADGPLPPEERIVAVKPKLIVREST